MAQDLIERNHAGDAVSFLVDHHRGHAHDKAAVPIGDWTLCTEWQVMQVRPS
jgi:hypothetical protein